MTARDRAVGDVMPRQVTPLPKTKTPKKPRKGLPKVKKTSAAAEERKATRLWGEYVHARDRVCVVCKRSDVKLEAHHILTRGHKATRADETNGVLLCFTHHKGRGGVHDDPQFAVNLYTALLGVDGYEALRAKAKAGAATSVAFWKGEQARLSALLDEVSRG